jgi:putative SOS response-associated peptidase YedK
MCGRYAITLPPEAMTGLFDLSAPAPDYVPRWNVAPSQPVPIIRQTKDGAREAALVRWGLHPAWMKEPPGAKSMINARAEGVAEKPFFRDAYKRRRCLFVMDGFYEWKRAGDVKIPHFIRRRDCAPLVIAGLWERWKGEAGEIDTAALITVAANRHLSAVHDRMPAILEPEVWPLWLDPKAPAEPLGWALAPAKEDLLEAYPVSRKVNSPANDGPDLISPA